MQKKLNIIILTSESMSSNALFAPIIQKHADEIKAIVVTEQVSGSLSKKIKTYLKLFRRMSKKFFLYKLIEGNWYVLCTRVRKLLGLRHGPLMQDTCKIHNIPFCKLEDINADTAVEQVQRLKPDVILCYSSAILKAPIIQQAKIACFNCHGSLLPLYRGAAQYIWYLLHNVTQAGVSIHLMDEQLDMGDLAYQKEFNISTHDTAYRIHSKIAHTGSEAYLDVLAKIKEGTISFEKQQEGTYFGIPSSKDTKSLPFSRLVTVREFFGNAT